MSEPDYPICREPHTLHTPEGVRTEWCIRDPNHLPAPHEDRHGYQWGARMASGSRQVHNQHAGQVTVVQPADPNALTREDQLKIHALQLAAKFAESAAHQLHDAQEIHAWLAAE